MRKAAALLALLLLGTSSAAAGRQAPAPLTDQQIETFLLNARVVKTRAAPKGVTGSIRATLTDGTLTHDAQIQDVDESRRRFESPKGVEFDFRDNWRYNIAAYRIDRLLELNLVPVSVERRWRTGSAAFTWWVDDVIMDEGERLRKELTAPNTTCWNEQVWLLRVFDQLIENTDRNLGNLLITRDWRMWAIDHTRAFRKSRQPKGLKTLTRIDRRVLERLRALDLVTLKQAVGRWVGEFELKALLDRRDAIVAHFEARGEHAFYDRRPVVSCAAFP